MEVYSKLQDGFLGTCSGRGNDFPREATSCASPPSPGETLPKPLHSNRAKTDQDCDLPSFLVSSSS